MMIKNLRWFVTTMFVFGGMSLCLLDQSNPVLNLIADILHQGSRLMLRWSSFKSSFAWNEKMFESGTGVRQPFFVVFPFGQDRGKSLGKWNNYPGLDRSIPFYNQSGIQSGLIYVQVCHSKENRMKLNLFTEIITIFERLSPWKEIAVPFTLC